MTTDKMVSVPGAPVVGFPGAQGAPLQFGALLKARRRQARLSQKDLADMMHVTRNTVINWEADKSRPDYAMLPVLCTLLNIRLHELFGIPAENGLSPLEDRVVRHLRALSPAGRRVADRLVSALAEEEQRALDARLKEDYALFLVRPGSLAAGTGSEVPDLPPEYTFLRRNQLNARADGIALVDGCSMEPVYHSGDYVYYQAASSADPGEDVLVDTDDGAVIKRVGPTTRSAPSTRPSRTPRRASRTPWSSAAGSSASSPPPTSPPRAMPPPWKSFSRMRSAPSAPAAPPAESDPKIFLAVRTIGQLLCNNPFIR